MDKCDDSVLDNIRPDSSTKNAAKSTKQPKLNQNTKPNNTKNQQGDSQTFHSASKNKKAKRLPWNTQVLDGKFHSE